MVSDFSNDPKVTMKVLPGNTNPDQKCCVACTAVPVSRIRTLNREFRVKKRSFVVERQEVEMFSSVDDPVTECDELVVKCPHLPEEL